MDTAASKDADTTIGKVAAKRSIYPPLIDDPDLTEEGSSPSKNWAIRCLELEPGTGDEELSCRLVPYHLGEIGGKYEALSYTWGNSEKNRTIHVNGQPFKITRNLESALRHLRRPQNERVLWIDALCINQKDMSEVNKCVQRMWAIYEKARNVVVFLGESRFGSDEALHLLFELTCLPVEVRDRHDQITRLLQDNGRSSQWNALLELMHRPWWGRAWVIQEFAVARKTIFLCGSARLGGHDFEQALEYLIDYRYNAMVPQRWLHLVRQVASTPISHLLTIRRHYQLSRNKQNGSALDILYRSRSSMAFDARDKVYSLFRLISENPKLQPDYDRPIGDLYKDVVEAMVESSGTLEILSHHNRGVVGIPGLPSWCPDWSVLHGKRLILWKKEYSAAGGSRAQASIHGDTLTIKGKVLDRIQWVSHAFEARHLGDKNKLYTIVMEVKKNALNKASIANKRKTDMTAEFRETLVNSRVLEKGLDGWKSRVLDSNTIEKMWNAWPLSLQESRPLDSERKKLVKVFQDAMYSSLYGRAFFVSQQGYLGLVDRSAQIGDVVMVGLGGEVLFALHEMNRKLNFSSTDSEHTRYQLVGEW